MSRDYHVKCLNCEADYTPKARERPSRCYECGSDIIIVSEVNHVEG